MYKNRIVHFHIFKNAGTSVDTVLRDYFKQGWAPLEDTKRTGTLAPSKILAHFNEHPEIYAISSHTARPIHANKEYFAICFLRHPLLRMRSVYSFNRLDPTQPFHALSTQHNLAGFLREVFNSEHRDVDGIVIRNFQVRYLSSATFRTGGDLTPRDLDDAVALIRDWGGIGIVDDYTRSRLWYQAQIRTFYPDFEFCSSWDNRTRQMVRSEEEEIAELKVELGADLYHYAVRENMLDIALYYWARNFNELSFTKIAILT